MLTAKLLRAESKKSARAQERTRPILSELVQNTENRRLESLSFANVAVKSRKFFFDESSDKSQEIFQDFENLPNSTAKLGIFWPVSGHILALFNSGLCSKK